MKSFVLFIISFLCASYMNSQCVGTTGLDLYWVGTSANGSGNFNDTLAWRVGSMGSTQRPCQAPRSSDNVFFMSSAFPLAGAVVTLNLNSNCRNMFWESVIGTQPSFVGASNRSLDIFGNLQLADVGSMDMSGFQASVSFRGSGALSVYTLDTRGHLLCWQNFLMALGSETTELRLLSPLELRTIAGNFLINSFNPGLGGILRFQTGHFRTQGHFVRAAGIVAPATGVRLDISNSRLVLRARSTSTQQVNSFFSVDIQTAGNFSAAGSHVFLQVDTAGTDGLSARLSSHSNMQFDSLTIGLAFARQRVFQLSNVISRFNSNYLHVLRNTELHTVNFRSNKLILEDGVRLTVASGFDLVCDELVSPAFCGGAAIIQADLAGTTPTLPRLRKLSAGGVLDLGQVVCKNIDAVPTSTYIATAGYDAGGNQNIQFTAVNSCAADLYFRPTAGNRNWHNRNNWYFANGTPAMQLPSPATNVYFGGHNTVLPAADAEVVVDSGRAHCNNFTCLPSMTRRITFRTNPSAGLVALGNLLLDSMSFEHTGTAVLFTPSGIGLYGVGKWLKTNTTPSHTGALMTNSHIYFPSGSDYELRDSVHVNSIIMSGWSMLRTQNVGINAVSTTLSGRVMQRSNITYRTQANPMINEVVNGGINYIDTCFFYVNDAIPSQSQTISATTPNLVFDTRANVRCSPCRVQGDMIVKRDLNLAFVAGSEVTQARVTGNLYILNASGLIISGANPSSDSLVVLGRLVALGNCLKSTIIRTHNGNAVPFRIGNGAQSQVENAVLSGLNNSGGSQFVAQNSTDNGGNSNILFAPSTGTTYYWRARSNNPSIFTGNWSDPAHWTTNPSQMVGDSACVPSLSDNVIFDLFSHNSGSICTIDNQALCRNFSATHGNKIVSPSVNQNWFIAGNFYIATTVDLDNYRGNIHFVGDGNFTIQTSSRRLHCANLIIDNEVGTWRLLSPLYLSNTHDLLRSGRLYLNGGSLLADGHDITLENAFYSETNKARTFDFSGSSIHIYMNAVYHPTLSSNLNRPWTIQNAQLLQLSAGNIFFYEARNTETVEIRLGGGLQYGNIHIVDSDQTLRITGSSTIGFADWNSSITLENAALSFDSLALYGGHFYTFPANSTQTLRSPHGKLLARSASNIAFINLRSNVAGTLAFIYKDHGIGFCIDYLKVQDVVARRQPNLALVPAPYDASHLSGLWFDTGENCDDILGSATADPSSIWRFSLPVLIQPQFAGFTPPAFCGFTTQASPSFQVAMTGTSPYQVAYTWDDGSMTGSGVVQTTDTDANPLTPHLALLPLNGQSSLVEYSISVTTFRCGEPSPVVPQSIQIQRPVPGPLTPIQQTASCQLNNSPDWLTFLGAGNQLPMLSVMDFTGTGDNHALGLVQSSVNFSPSVQTVLIGGVATPYLQRDWQVVAQNNGAARLRFYFTQAELDALAAAAGYTSLDPTTQIRVLRYASGQLGVGVEEIRPHTVLSLAVPTQGDAAPFSTTTGLIGVEIDVPSFSAFIIVPTETLLSFDLLDWIVEKLPHHPQKTHLFWRVNDSQEAVSYHIERMDAQGNRQEIGLVPSRRLSQEDSYTYIDHRPVFGYNYYRLSSQDDSGNRTYSDWRSLLFEDVINAQILPNPAKDFVTLSLASPASIEIRLYNAVGQIALQLQFNSPSNQFDLPIANLPSGVYSLQIIHTDYQSIQTMQFVKE